MLDVLDLVVAPLVGAWIEIMTITAMLTADLVAPLVGAWIEISLVGFSFIGFSVAPLVGAWIEISVATCSGTTLICRSPRGSVD